MQLHPKEYVAEQGMNIPNLSKIHRLLWLHSRVFTLGNKPQRC